MSYKRIRRQLWDINLLLFIFLLPFSSSAQFLMDMIDTTKETGQGILSVYKKYDHLRIGGYIQPQFQLAQNEGIASYEGPNFPSNVSNRFTLRRSRVRMDYVHFGSPEKAGVQVVFQFDVNERGFTIRDVWGRVFENKYQLFSLATGMFACPFGYEINLSSSDRETPERGRMSQSLMRGERDLGAMVSFDPRKKNARLKYLKADVGLFNGQGINAAGEFDNHKDLIARISLKPFPLSKTITLSGSLSYLDGGLLQNTKYKYRYVNEGGVSQMKVDSSLNNIGEISPRRYYGADVQIKIRPRKLTTELRAEYITGIQTGTEQSAETPNTLVASNTGFHIRRFDGAYFYLLQQIFSERHQLMLKYDWYDPNTQVAGKDIGAPGANVNATNIKYSTLGIGYLYHINENVKLTLYYARVWNESTQLNAFINDIRDDVFTCRIQYRF
ncbi:MAG: porin [Bacteroidetes bacterium]|nr:porin [Bacteroidota bacterium]